MGKRVLSTVKTCTKCNVEYPNTLEYFGKNQKVLRSICKVCRNTENRAYYLKNLEKSKAVKQAWKKANKDKYREMNRKYRALKLGVLHEDWTETQVVDLYGTDCYLCDTPIDFDAPRKGIGSDYSLWVDHVIPQSAFGENTIRNVRPCHSKCNRAKRNKSLSEYLFLVTSQETVI